MIATAPSNNTPGAIYTYMYIHVYTCTQCICTCTLHILVQCICPFILCTCPFILYKRPHKTQRCHLYITVFSVRQIGDTCRYLYTKHRAIIYFASIGLSCSAISRALTSEGLSYSTKSVSLLIRKINSGGSIARKLEGQLKLHSK